MAFSGGQEKHALEEKLNQNRWSKNLPIDLASPDTVEDLFAIFRDDGPTLDAKVERRTQQYFVGAKSVTRDQFLSILIMIEFFWWDMPPDLRWPDHDVTLLKNVNHLMARVLFQNGSGYGDELDVGESYAAIQANKSGDAALRCAEFTIRRITPLYLRADLPKPR